MSDIRKVLLTPIGAYMQDEDGQGWTLLTKDEAEAALVDEKLHHLTNEEAEQHFQREIDVAKFRDAIEALMDVLKELVDNMCEGVDELVSLVCQAIENQYKEKPPRPDYKARPKCCTRAKTKRHRKQRSRER